MSDEFAKTIVLGDRPFSKPAESSGVSDDDTNKPAGTSEPQEKNQGLNYPAFEDTSWLT